MRLKTLLLLCVCSLASAAGVTPGQFPGGGIVTPNSADPRILPRVLSSSGTFTFLGSFKLPTNIDTNGLGAEALSVSGSTLYVGGNFYNLTDSNYLTVADGIGAATIPTLSGAPAFDGSNAGAACNSLPCSTGSGLIFRPVRNANIIAPANYTVTATPALNATSATFTSAPAGFAAGTGAIPNWFVKFTNGTNTQDVVVTGWNSGTKTFTWSGGLSHANYSTTVSAYQWNPSYPFGYASGDRITGSQVYGGTLYLTGGAYYDANCSANLGWIVSATAADGSAWGSVNTVSGYPAAVTVPQGGGSVPVISRRYAGQLGVVPAIWQPLLGGPLFVAAGEGALSNVGCQIPIGFSFSTFDPASVTGAVAVPIKPLLDYPYQGGSGDAFTSALPQQLTGRIFAGPLPKAATQGFPATLASAPIAGATSAAFAASVISPGTVSALSTITIGSNNLCITSITSGTIQNSGIWYTVSGTGIPAGSPDYIFPADDQGPGNPTGSASSCVAGTNGNYQLHTAATQTLSGNAVTLTPQGYAAGYYQLTIGGSSEQRIVHLQDGQAAIPFKFTGSNDPTTFSTLNSDGTLTSGQALTCVPSCTTAVQVLRMGDYLTGQYSGDFGTAIIVPGSRSLIDISLHEYGPLGARADVCDTGSSGTNQIALPPDTAYYIQMQVTAFDLADALSASQVYTPTPYAVWAFPGEASLHSTTLAARCLTATSSGWATYDPTTGIMYAALHTYVSSGSGGGIVVYEWQVNSMFLLLLAVVRRRRAANDERFAVAA